MSKRITTTTTDLKEVNQNQVETFEIDKSQDIPEDDDDDDDDDDDIDPFGDDDLDALAALGHDGEGEDGLDGAYFQGEGDETFSIGGPGDEDDEDNDDDLGKGDTEAHDGGKYDESIINMAQITWKNHKDSVFSITIDLKEQIIVSGSGDDTAAIIDMTNGNIIYHLNHHFDDSITKVSFSPDYIDQQKYLAIASMSGLIQIYTLDSILSYRDAKRDGDTTTELVFEQEFNPEFDLDTFAWHPNSPILAIACSNGQLWTYNLITQESRPYYGHNDGITSLIFTKDGNSMVSTSLDGQVIINPLTKDKKQIKHKQIDKESPPGISLVMHPSTDSNLICLGSANGGLYTLSAIDTIHNGPKNSTAHSDSVEKVMFYQINPKTLYLFSASIDGTLKAWNYTDSLQARYTISLPYAITSFYFHPIAPLLFVASHDGIARVYHAVDGRHIMDFTGHQDAILDMILFKDYLWTCSDDKTVRMFDLNALLPAEVLQPPQTVVAPTQGNAPGGPKGNIFGGNFQRRPVVKPGKPTPKPQ